MRKLLFTISLVAIMTAFGAGIGYATPYTTTSDDGRYRISIDWDTLDFIIENLNTLPDPIFNAHSWFFRTPTYGLFLDSHPLDWGNASVIDANNNFHVGSSTSSASAYLGNGDVGNFSFEPLPSAVDYSAIDSEILGSIMQISAISTFSIVAPDYIVNGPQPVPEPSTMLLFGTGLIGLAGIKRKRRSS